MKKIALALAISLVAVGGAYADDEINAVSATETVFRRYVVNPAQFIVGGAWGITRFLFRVGQAPVDKTFELIGAAIGRDPNAPLF